MKRELHSLLDLIHFTEKVSTKIRATSSEKEILNIIAKEFAKSKRYEASILFTTSDGNSLQIAASSVAPKTVKKGEKATGLKIFEYKIDLRKSSFYRSVIEKAITIQTTTRDIIEEFLPKPIVLVVTRILGYKDDRCILTPLYRHRKVIGILAMSSTDLSNLLVPSVVSLAQHISTALLIAQETAKLQKAKSHLARQIEYNILRAEIWKLALNKKLSQQKLIEQMLHKVGPVLEVSRACYNTRTERNEWVCVTEWCDKDVKPSLGAKMPEQIATHFFKEDVFLLTSKSALELIPEPVRRVAKPLVKKLIRSLDLESVLLVPHYLQGQPVGILTFDVCTTNKKKTEWTNDDKQIVREMVSIVTNRIAQEKAQEQIQKQRTQLEEMVAKRTIKLRELNERLKQDVAKRKIAEATLRESEQKWRLLVSNLPDIVMTVAKDGTILAINRTVRGYTVDETIGTKVYDYITKDQCDLVRKCIAKVFKTGKPEIYEILAAGPEGPNTAWYETRVVPGKNRAGMVVWTTHICADVTERKRAQQKILEAKNAAEKASKAKSDFLSSMSHELRTPLTSILGFAELLQKQLKSSETEQKMFESIIRNSRHLLGLINGLLDLSKIESGKMTMLLEKTNVVHVLKHTVAEMVPLLRERPVSLNLDVSDYLPVVMTDGVRLKQVIINVLSNAVKFTEKGSITVQAKPPKPTDFYLEIRVIDSGIGIPKEKTSEIFEKFTQLNRAKPYMGGAGVGLSVSRTIMELLGGSIQVQSHLGKGSTFTILVPLTATQ